MKAFFALFLLSITYSVSGVIHVPLQNQNNIYIGPFAGYEYVVATVSIGTPPQNLTVTLDTGSSNFWVPGTNYGGFNSTASSTFVSLDQSSEINYLEGSMSGFLGTDTVSIDYFHLDSVTFMSAMEVSDVDFGVLGLAYPKIATYHHPTFLEQIVMDGLVDEASFSFYLNENISFFVLGGIEPKFANSEFKYFPLIGNGYWSTNASLTLGDFTLASQIEAVFDTGTYLMYLDQDLHNIFLKKTGIKANKNYKNIDQFESITLHMGNDTLVITPQIYMVYDSDSKTYSLNLYPQELLGAKEILLGDIFLKTYYTHWDYTNMRIGFAEPADPAGLSSFA